MELVYDRVGNIVGEGENGGLPQCFQKASTLGPLKVSIVWLSIVQESTRLY